MESLNLLFIILQHMYFFAALYSLQCIEEMDSIGEEVHYQFRDILDKSSRSASNNNKSSLRSKLPKEMKQTFKKRVFR